MSKENIITFLEAAKNNPELQKQIGAIYAEAKKSTAEELAKLAADAGTPFTAEEFVAASRSAQGELSEAQLEGVAGGAGVPDFESFLHDNGFFRLR